MKNTLLKKCFFMAAAMVLYAACTGTIVYAALGGDTKNVVVTNDEGSKENDLICIKETIKDGRYTVIMNGVPKTAKDDLLEKIEENIDSIRTGEPVKFINTGFVDADKFSNIYHNEEEPDKNYDSGQCWLASTSDMLVIGGWAQGLYDPLNEYAGNSDFLSEKFTDEDDVFLYLTSNFGYYADFQKNGIAFFFDGLFRRYSPNGTTMTTKKTSLKNSVGTEQEGLYKDVFSGKLVKEYIFTDNTDALSALDDFESCSYGAEVNFDGNGGHAVTLVGTILDNTKTGSEKYAAVFIADSDNESSADIDIPPASMEAAYLIRKNRVNSYTMYGLEISEKTTGEKAVLVKGYKSNLPGNVFLESVTTLPFKSDSVMNSAKETAENATKDAKNYADFMASYVMVQKDDFSDGTMTENDKLVLTFGIVNARDNPSLTKENFGTDCIKNKIEILKDGVLYKTIEDGLDIDTSDSDIFNEWGGFTGTLDLDEIGIDLTAGDYVAKLYVNTNNAMEAYVSNNTPVEFSFTIEP